ncbi:MAG TPA: lipolytic protein G-D-S-L family [Cyanothece sp. UBA12306]|nr:lipolytic protein G-D-S-L family [Cyanothece sp. UBA12306]
MKLLGVKMLMITLAVILGFLMIIEGSLRLFLGLGKRPLYVADPEIGYLLAPNQKMRRLGKTIILNQYSMRSAPIDKQRRDDHLRIFLLGDSIANGAWWTDQKETISALIAQTLVQVYGKEVEVLNASANSWGPRNQLAYLKRFGTFESQIIILLMNTDDFFATAPTSLPVGRDRYYPDRQPLSAIGEIWERFLAPSQPIPGMAEIMNEKGDRVGINLQAIKEIREIASQNQAQFFIALTPLKREVETQPRDYEQRARERLKKWALSQKISLIDFLPIFQKNSKAAQLYRDSIHLSPLGNQLVSEQISQLDFRLSK